MTSKPLSAVQQGEGEGASNPVPKRKLDPFTLLHDKSRQQGESLVKVDRIMVIIGNGEVLKTCCVEAWPDTSGKAKARPIVDVPRWSKTSAGE